MCLNTNGIKPILRQEKGIIITGFPRHTFLVKATQIKSISPIPIGSAKKSKMNDFILMRQSLNKFKMMRILVFLILASVMYNARENIAEQVNLLRQK